MKRPVIEESEEKKIFNQGDVVFDDLETIVNGKEVKDFTTKYPLAKGVTLTITDTEKDYDYGFLCVYGIYINITIRPTKKGTMFVSYPSVKDGRGGYKNVVTNYSKVFNDVINQVLARHYEV